MIWRIRSIVLLALLVLGTLTFLVHIQPVEARTIIVPDDYPTIQAAIDAASPGDTVYVRAGTYREAPDVNKALTLVGESPQNTIIDLKNSSNYEAPTFALLSDYVNVTGFTIRENESLPFGFFWYVIRMQNVSHCNIIGNTITNLKSGGNGIDLYLSCNYNNITGNDITGMLVYGVGLASSCEYNSITGNTITANKEAGVALYGSCNHNSVTGNIIIANGLNNFSWPFAGVSILDSSYNSVVGNNITNNGRGIHVGSSSGNSVVGNNIRANEHYGVHFYNSSSNSVVKNDITNNSEGIYLDSSFDNSVVANNITANNLYGVSVWPESSNNISLNNVFYHNSFVGNARQVRKGVNALTNVWDDGYPSGGNYWSDYVGVDSKSGPNQDQPGSDGIGDTPYVIDSNNTDHYPLVYEPSPVTYEVTVDAHCTAEAADVNVDIAMDGASTGLRTPHTFTGLNGAHILAVPGADVEGHPFSQWSTGQTSTTITVYHGGTYTAYFSAPAPSGNITRVPQDYGSVQAAVDAASPGSTILISPGVYNESIIVNKPLTIIGRLGSEPIFRGGGSGIAITLLQGASGSVISGIIITSWDEGILVNGATGCRIYNNIMSLTSVCGIAVRGNNAQSNFVTSNVFQNNTVAVDLNSDSYNNTVYRNIITTNELGILLGPGRNLVYANTIIGNSIALNLTNSSNNLIFHNNFLNNSVQAAVLTSAGNTWDDGYPSGGNYWSDHIGPDLNNGTNQDQPGSDGIVDTPYKVAGGGVDRYPLAQPFNAHDIGITDFAVMKTVVGGGYAVWMEVKVLNYGVHDEDFNITIFANSSVAARQSVALENCSYSIISLEWNTADFDSGNYSMSVRAGPVAGETNTADDNFTDGFVIVSLVGDIMGGVNGACDGRVDMKDISYVARCFGADPSQKLWNPNADINGDGKIDMKDIALAARHFGEHYP